MNLNLDKIIAAMEARSKELEEQMLNLSAPDPQRFTDRFDALLELMTHTRGEILGLRAIRSNSRAASVIVNPASPAEVAELTASLKALDRVIRQGEVFDQVIAIATAALKSAATLRGVAGQGAGAGDSKTAVVMGTRGVRLASAQRGPLAPERSERSPTQPDAGIRVQKNHLDLTVPGKKSVTGFRLKLPADAFKLRRIAVRGLPSKSVPTRVAVTGGELLYEWKGAGAAPGSQLTLEIEATHSLAAGSKVVWIHR